MAKLRKMWYFLGMLSGFILQIYDIFPKAGAKFLWITLIFFFRGNVYTFYRCHMGKSYLDLGPFR
jgi:hypothetical protein